MGNIELDQIGQVPGQGSCALVSDTENFEGGSVILDHGFDLPDDGRVGTTAESLIRGDGNNKSLLDADWGFLFMQVDLILQDFGDGTYSEEFGPIQSSDILSHLGGSHHLHSLWLIRRLLW